MSYGGGREYRGEIYFVKCYCTYSKKPALLEFQIIFSHLALEGKNYVRFVETPPPPFSPKDVLSLPRNLKNTFQNFKTCQPAANL